MTRQAEVTRWVGLLRGVNVGGVKVLSADLRATVATAGFERVRTVLASGNVLFDAAGSESEIAERVMAALEERYERAVPTIVRSQAQIAADVAACPYPADSDTHHAYLVYAVDEAGADDLYEAAAAALTQGANDGEAVSSGNRLVYWWCPRGSTLSTPVSAASARVARRVLTTTRNARTMAKLASG